MSKRAKSPPELERLRESLLLPQGLLAPVHEADVRWAINRICEAERERAELTKWRKLFSSPDTALKSFERMRDVIDEALGERK